MSYPSRQYDAVNAYLCKCNGITESGMETKKEKIQIVSYPSRQYDAVNAYLCNGSLYGDRMHPGYGLSSLWHRVDSTWNEKHITRELPDSTKCMDICINKCMAMSIILIPLL